jgi:cytochrome b involved in lipid metabolism
MSVSEVKQVRNAGDAFTEAELAERDGIIRPEMWISVHGVVCDVTGFIDKHPGGAKALKKYVGRDGTHAFEALYHSDRARKMVAEMKIGILLSNQQ